VGCYPEGFSLWRSDTTDVLVGTESLAPDSSVAVASLVEQRNKFEECIGNMVSSFHLVVL
jgi:hypothetical protein